MTISIESLFEGAQRAHGTVVIIDVFRAFTTASVAFTCGAEKIIMVAEPDQAIRLREAGYGDVCVGEVGGIAPEGFEFGNSPHEIAEGDVEGQRLIQTTRNGTLGVTTVAGQADAIYAGALINARATVNAILADEPEHVTLVAMGTGSGTIRADEDEQCALYLRNLLEGRQPDPEAVRSLLLASGEIPKYHDPALPHLHPEDIDYALRIDAVDLAIRVEMEEGLAVARVVG